MRTGYAASLLSWCTEEVPPRNIGQRWRHAMSEETDKAGNGSDKPSPGKMSETIDGETGRLDPTRLKIDLANLRDVRLELAYVYRQMAYGTIEDQSGTKRAYVLKTIHDVIVSAELERRIIELEEQAIIASEGRSGFQPRALN